MWSIGMDGGGTHTRAVLADPAGRVVADDAAGPGNYQLVGLAGVVELVLELVSRLEARSGCSLDPSQLSLCVGLAGAGRVPEQEAIAAGLRRAGVGAQIKIVSDARAGLEGAHGSAPGIVVISGTGSMVLGKSGSGEEVRAGGLGPLLGDEGSGYALVLEGLREVLRARDGWAPATRLTSDLAEAFGLSDWDDVIPRVYGGDLDREQIAAAAPVLCDAARDGDAAAQRIVGAGMELLGRQVGAVAGRLAMASATDVACLGGVFSRVEQLWPELERGARAEGEKLRRVPARLPPVYGALLMAWQATGRPVADDWVEQLAASPC
ncbi:BadF/BadG/BcrA/BcrD ATPase family protein [Candidatus Latescibacterota bacterium]